jgi:hypothetical protein
MDPGVIASLVPIVAIVGGISAGIIKRYLGYKERELELRFQSGQAADSDLARQIQELRKEIAQLRDTSTAYDLSIDHQLQDLEHRVHFIEDKRIEAAAGDNAKENVQQLGQIR